MDRQSFWNGKDFRVYQGSPFPLKTYIKVRKQTGREKPAVLTPS